MALLRDGCLNLNHAQSRHRWWRLLQLLVIFSLLHVAPTSASQNEAWHIKSGLCIVSGGCIHSPNWPAEYPKNDTCLIEVPRDFWDDQEIKVIQFQTEGCCDKLIVNGVSYSNTQGPAGVKPSGQITWSSDQNTVREGWKLCPEKARLEVSSALCGSGCDENDSTDNGGLGVYIGLAVGAVVLLACALFIARRLCSGNGHAKPPDPVTAASIATGTATPATGCPDPLDLKATTVAAPGVVLQSTPGAAPAPMGKVSSELLVGRKMSAKQRLEALPAGEGQTPSYWEARLGGLPARKLEAVSTEALQTMQELMDSTFKNITTRDRRGAPPPRRLKLVHAHRIENVSLWKRYAADRYDISRRRAGSCSPITAYGGELLTNKGDTAALHKSELRSDINEALLFHGTSPKGAFGITDHGFRLSYAATNAGNLFGNGIYFAECSSKSDEYAKDDEDGIYKGLYCLLLCRVTLGNMMRLTAGGTATHKMINEAVESDNYDSVLGDREASVGTYREFVVYEEAAAYPEYLILYSREYGDPQGG